jgi:hypothetical protein
MKNELPTWFVFLVWACLAIMALSLFVESYNIAAFVFGSLIILYLDYILTIQAALLTQAQQINSKLHAHD